MSIVFERAENRNRSQQSKEADQQTDLEQEPSSRPLDLGLFHWLFGYTRPYARKRNCLLFLVLVRSMQLPLLAWCIAQLINGPIAGGSATGLLWGTLGYLALAAFTQSTLHFRQRLALELGEAVVHDLRNDVFEHLQRMRMSFFNRNRLGRIISRISSDVEAVRAGVQDSLFTSLVGIGQMCMAAALMLFHDRVMFLIVAATVPVLWAINRRFRGKLSKAHRNVHESFSRVTASLAESVCGIHVTQGFVRQEQNARLFRDLVSNHSRYNVEAARTAGVFIPLLEFNSQLFLATLLLLGGYRVLTPGIDMPVGDLIQFFFLANLFFAPIQTVGDQYNQALSVMAGAERLRDLLATPPEWDEADNALKPGSIEGEVRFEHVDFAYDTGRPVLHDVSFTVRPGQTVALVGHTGSGKTSIINLVAKFYLPTSGRVRIDGIDTRDIDTKALHEQLGIVVQQNFLFSGTVLENVRMGRPEASDEEVMQAVTELGCLDLIESLPHGFHTEVGEAGSRLSLGQRQVVCFARAMLANPRILILDEATSSVDVFTENRLQQALVNLLRGRTSFVVAHRLSTIRDADQVLVIDHGRLVEWGTHHELLSHPGVYSELHGRFAVAQAA